LVPFGTIADTRDLAPNVFSKAGKIVVASVLIVEDETQVLTLAESYLQEHGHETLSASSIIEATAILEGNIQIDALFTDLGLQGNLEAGLKIAAAAVQNRPHLKVLYTSGQAITDGMRALFVPKSAVLPKPYTVDQLLAGLSMLGVIHPARS
jgi:CheY-like chemotaxis protein